jgi:hypothetical protein
MDSNSTIPILSALFVVIVLGASTVRRRRRRWLRLRGEPTPNTPRADAAELERRLAASCPPEAAIVYTKENGTITLTWQLHGIPWATLLFRRKLRATQAIDLRLQDGRAVATCREGTIEWETAAATWMPKAKVSWRGTATVAAELAERPDAPPVAPSDASPRTLTELVRHVRPIVNGAGWTFDPVLDFPT